MTLIHGLNLPDRLAALMQRPDWVGKRRDEYWLAAFGHPRSGFVDFIPLELARLEAEAMRNDPIDELTGAPDPDDPPGDVCSLTCTVIGFVAQVDDAILVDPRPATGPSIIYCVGDAATRYRMAFSSIDAFAAYYEARHGR